VHQVRNRVDQPVVDSRNGMMLLANLFEQNAGEDNNAMSEVDTIDLATGKVIDRQADFNFINSTLADENLDFSGIRAADRPRHPDRLRRGTLRRPVGALRNAPGCPQTPSLGASRQLRRVLPGRALVRIPLGESTAVPDDDGAEPGDREDADDDVAEEFEVIGQ
jgi:hypothetical protein